MIERVSLGQFAFDDELQDQALDGTIGEPEAVMALTVAVVRPSLRLPDRCGGTGKHGLGRAQARVRLLRGHAALSPHLEGALHPFDEVLIPHHQLRARVRALLVAGLVWLGGE